MRTGVLFVCAVAALAWAQQPPATLRGTVIDPSGRGVPGVIVEVEAEGRDVSVRAVSDQRGEYVAAGLPEGGYGVSGEAAGFQRFDHRGVQLAAGQVTSLDIALEIRPVESSLVVVSKAPLLEGEKETPTRNYQEVLEIRGAGKLLQGRWGGPLPS